MFSIVQKLISAADSQGVIFHYNKPVKKIVTNGKKAESIILEDDSEVKADIIVANADLPYVYRKLLPDRRKSKSLTILNTPAQPSVITGALTKFIPSWDITVFSCRTDSGKVWIRFSSTNQ
ncbi:MAG: hypothetical protein IPJ16_01105 [Bacteroidales bacterium]|nr:hypothetical protein [Bacteroidales bacterium]